MAAKRTRTTARATSTASKAAKAARQAVTADGQTPRAATGRELPPVPEGVRVAGNPTAHEIAQRRYRVLQLRYHRRLTNLDIGRMLGVSDATIERDLAWWREQWRGIYGSEAPTFDPIEAIGETVALYQQIEERALQELATLSADNLAGAVSAVRLASTDPAASPEQRDRALVLLTEALAVQRLQGRASYQRMRALKVVQEARGALVGFLQDLGLLDRNLGTFNVKDAETATTLAAQLAALREVHPELLQSPAERAQKGKIH